ncbi:hypothetical protein FACS1894202_08810 [Clostridia bacterium]|nr:hypothetical protein FACS1894202_08810 [Clostridia bacterium]
MKKFFSGVVTVLAIAAVVFSACYAMGVFGKDNVTRVSGQAYSDGDFTYSGELRGGLFEGEGVLSFRNGDTFSGNFTGGRMSGRGVFRGREGWSFEGDFADGAVNGGTFTLEDGSVDIYERENDADSFKSAGWRYDGPFGARGQDGAGTFTFADGSVYSGSFSRGMAEGGGVLTDASGKTVYEGGFAAGLFEGHGVYYSPEGWSYEGGFKDGLFDGEGAVTINGETIRGVWAKGGQTERYE